VLEYMSYMRIRNIFITAFLSLALFVVGGQHFVQATASDNLFGYAWSDNIGWISFNNCTSSGGSNCSGIGYGVRLNAGTGNLSGYAWSDNIGWISFNETSGCPLSGCTTQPSINIGTGAFSGWARALSHGGGWDGWIHLSGASLDSSTSGVRNASGFIWGSDVVGWVDMSRVSWGGASTVPTVTLSTSTTNVVSGGTATLTWVSANTTSCTASATPNRTDWAWTSTTNLTSTTGASVTLGSVPVTYILTCINASNQSAQSSVTITPQAPEFTVSLTPSVNLSTPFPSSGGSFTLTWSATTTGSGTVTCNKPWWVQTMPSPSNSGSQSVTVTTTTGFTIVCTDGTSIKSASQTATVGSPTLTLNASAQSATSWMLYWGSNAERCEAVTPTDWTAKTTRNGMELKTNITTETTFTIRCYYSGSTTLEKSVTVGTPASSGLKKIKPIYKPL
jgi:hypothetical protein